MIQKFDPLTSKDFDKGLVTRSDVLKLDMNQSPDCLDIKWNFDGSIQKRLGSSTMNSTALQGTGGWASFDFGATSRRWLVVAAGTGIHASSNLGVDFFVVQTSRTQTYQYFERSKNVCIATSDAYDVPLFWNGTGTTRFETLAPGSAPSCKYSVNFQGFLILLNSLARPRGFFYADDDLQLVSAWPDSFDLPSSYDDEITGSFILNKRLYVSTRYYLYRVLYTGGNPDWEYLKVKDFGFVPRTARIVTLKGGEVAVGEDWSRRLRAFDGSDDVILSDNIENDNSMAEFSTSRISYAGSGLVINHSVYDPIEQEYRLCVAIGSASSETTHAILINARTLAMYPYSNQRFQSMCVAESANRQYLIGVDRSGRVHVINSGNLDINLAVDEHYDSPFIYRRDPAEVSKASHIDFYLTPTSSGTMNYQDRSDFSSVYQPISATTGLVTTNSVNLIKWSVDVPSTQNIYQFRLISSANTANPWKLVRIGYFLEGMGIGGN